MTTPPPIGWRPVPPSSPPPNQGGSYGQQPPQGPPPGAQGPWGQQPAPPPKKNNTIKWLLGAVAVLLVVAISIGATLLFTRDGGTGGGGDTSTSASPPPSDIASANDTGPVAIITDDPTCKALDNINNVLSEVQANGWSAERSSLGPASEWTDAQRSHIQAVTTAIGNATDQVIGLAKKTPHRVMRELYEQFVAYGRAYVASVSTYRPSDNLLADVNVSIGNSLLGICNGVDYGSANRALTLTPNDPPVSAASGAGSDNPVRFKPESASTCTEWLANEAEFVAGTRDWEKLDSNIPGAQWTQEHRATQEAALPVLRKFADNMQATGQASGNPAFDDFSVLAASYIRAYLSAVEGDYVAADSWLIYVALRLNNAISSVCKVSDG